MIEFYPRTNEEYDRNIVYIVYKGTIRNIDLLKQHFRIYDYPDLIQEKAKRWIHENFEMITNPYKNESFYNNLIKPEIESKKGDNSSEENLSEPSVESEARINDDSNLKQVESGLWQRLKDLFS